MASRPTIAAGERDRLENELALTDLLIALADESAAGQRLRATQPGLEGEALAGTLISLATIEASIELRRTERKRLLAALSGLSPDSPAAVGETDEMAGRRLIGAG
ncbi:MAG: hypothetical protein AB7G10_06945 [Reyranellaceae bacterium]